MNMASDGLKRQYKYSEVKVKSYHARIKLQQKSKLMTSWL